MVKVEVGKGRGQVERTATGLKITIPAKRNIFVVLFLGFWLIGWSFGEVAVLIQVFSAEKAPKIFLFAWLGGWTVGGVFAIYAWLWNIKGKEIINITRSELQHIHQLPIYKRSKEYDLSSITNLRAQEQNISIFGSRNGMEFWGISGGSIAFDYGRSTHKFGAQLDQAEAAHIINEIKQFNKNL